jgi:hypothetical protein
MEARIFIVALPDLQKIGMNKTVGRQYLWGQDQTNYIIKAVKDEKLPKWRKGWWTSWMLSPYPSGGETVNAVYITKALATPSQFSSWQGPDCRPRMSFCNGTMTQFTAPPQSRTFKDVKGVKTVCQPSFLPNIVSAEFLSFGEWSQSWPLQKYVKIASDLNWKSPKF